VPRIQLGACTDDRPIASNHEDISGDVGALNSTAAAPGSASNRTGASAGLQDNLESADAQPFPVQTSSAGSQPDDTTQLAAAIRNSILSRRRIIFDTDNAGCGRPGVLTCGSIRMRTVPCSRILAVDRVEVTDVGRDAVFGVLPVDAIVCIRITDMDKFRGQQEAGVVKCVTARGAVWSATTSTPVRFHLDAQRWRSGWRIVND
jgi:hypothetical protein